MKTMCFFAASVSSVSTYLNYFFPRYAGSWKKDETLKIEWIDTFDQKWANQNTIWARTADRTALIELPSLFEREASFEEQFELHRPLVWARSNLRVRSFELAASPENPVEGQLVRLKNVDYLILRADRPETLAPIALDLARDGFAPLDRPLYIGDCFALLRKPFLRPAPSVSPRGTDFSLDALAREALDRIATSRQYVQGIVEDVDTECLHQFRVSLRKARSTISTILRSVEDSSAQELSVALKTLMNRTNELRDLDVTLLKVSQLKAKIPWGFGKDLDAWESKLTEDRAAEFRRVKTWFRSKDSNESFHRALQLGADLAAIVPPIAVSTLSARAFARTRKRLEKPIRRLKPSSDDELLHELRIEIKKLRYSLESLEFTVPSTLSGLVFPPLREAQELLGEFHDRHVLLERLHRDVGSILDRTSVSQAFAFGTMVGSSLFEQERSRVRCKAKLRRILDKRFFKAVETLGRTASHRNSHGA